MDDEARQLLSEDKSIEDTKILSDATLQILENNNPKGFVSSIDKNKWEKVGFHRALGGFFYEFIFILFGMIVGIITTPLIFKYLQPYPEIKGYQSLAGGFFFAMLYTAFDFGTAYGIQRFIAEYRIKDPRMMLKYVQFFVWYQMMTGIIQVSLISYVVLKVLPNGEYGFLSWIFLIICQKQWPGMLGTFKSVLNGMQLYNKSAILSFINGTVFQNLTNIIFILAGRAYGQSHPEIGDLMGAAYGAAIGGYIDDFFAMFLSMHFVGKITEPFGISKWDLWKPEFGMDVAKRCMKLGSQMIIVPFVNAATGSLMLVMYYDAVPQYATFMVLASFGMEIAGIVNVGAIGNTTAMIAESYMNDKKELAKFYISTSIRWNGFLMWILTAILISFLPMILKIIFSMPGTENYVLAQVFIIPRLIFILFKPYIDFPNGILTGCERVSFFTFIRVLEEGMQTFTIWLYLYVLDLQNKTVFGLDGIVFILAFQHFFPMLIKMTICWVYINKKLFKININWWQTLIGPLLCSLIVIFIAQVYERVVFNPILEGINGITGIYVAAGITVAFMALFIPILIYLPLTGMMGCWDDYGLKTLERAADLAGPSKFIIKGFMGSVKRGIKFGEKIGLNLHNRFKIEWEIAARQIEELNQMKIDAEERVFRELQ